VRKQDVKNSVHRRMSTRLNKRKKGRGNHLNRERTVTTLTEGSEGSFVTAEDTHNSTTSSPFSAATISPNFSMSSSFPALSYGYASGAAAPPTSGQPAQFYSAPPAAPGQNDLEILEKLKEMIKNNQHSVFKPIPNPAALANVYLGPHGVSHVPPHPEQIPKDHSLSGQNALHVRSGSTASIGDVRKASAASINSVPGVVSVS
jgi:hypothetical protein